MKVLITGGAGFIGRWTVKRFLEEGYEVCALDNLENSTEANITDFKGCRRFSFLKGDIIHPQTLAEAFRYGPDLCLHLAARTKVSESLREPQAAVHVNVLGTVNVLEAARKKGTKTIIVGTCLVYQDSWPGAQVDERSPVNPLSPYAASKLSADYLALTYLTAYGLPVVICRPFNTYGPFQKGEMEGGVVAVFLGNTLAREPISVFGDGTQGRDLMYVEDSVEFLFRAATSDSAVGEVINAGTGRSVTINELASLIYKDEGMIKHVSHPCPQSEIRKLVCDYSKAKSLLDWEPKTSLEEGIAKTRAWMTNQ
ncbi:MAG: dTDP-glucose 4,6-dehydratase [Dehalococcoidia bacterium]